MASRIKAASLINAIMIVREVLGAARFQALVERCPAETQPLLRRTLVAVEWVALDQWAPFLAALFENVFRRDEPQFRRLLRAICKRDFSTVYRVYLNHASPHGVLSKATSIWAAYLDTGSLTTEPKEITSADRQVVIHLRGLESGHSFLTMVVHAYIEQLMAMAGADACTVQRSSEQQTRGLLSCDFLITLP